MDRYAELRAALGALSPGNGDAMLAYRLASDPKIIRALLADYDRLRASAKQVDALYPNVWDLVDGGLFIMPENVKRFDDSFDALRAALAQEQGEKHDNQD